MRRTKLHVCIFPSVLERLVTVECDMIIALFFPQTCCMTLISYLLLLDVLRLFQQKLLAAASYHYYHIF